MSRKRGLFLLAAVLLSAGLVLSGTRAQEGGLAVVFPPAQDRGEWIPMPFLLVPRQEVGVAVLDGKLYVIGGMQGGVALSSVEVFDPATRKWAFAASLPAPALDHIGAAVVGGKLYVVGGLGPGNSVRTVFQYDPGRGQWARKADMPTARGAMGVAVIGGKIYAAGGYVSRSSVADFARYDPLTDRWETLPPMPAPRDHLVAVALGERFHAIGGRRVVSRVGPLVRSHEVFDPATGQWSTRALLPTPRSGLGAGTLRGRIQVFGGEGNRLRSDGTFVENEEYDPLTNTWRTLTPMSLPRHGTNGGVIGDLLYVPGGGPREGFSETAAVDAFRYRNPALPSPPLKKIPRLQGPGHSLRGWLPR
jgi:N-acetylneuraminic acid mutarotase